ncbi:MAG: hypothetical protein GEU86_21020 [Actinophytocola sp.]|nr:hypothetical protein [Actinophytocola sp.]
MGQVPADDNPGVLAALDDIGQLKTTQSQRAAEREREIGERSSALDEREADVDTQVAKFDEREGKLDERKTALDRREKGLDKREKAIKSDERQVKANTVPGDGVFVVGKDIKAGTYRTSGPSASGIGSCYYAFKSGTGSDADIIDNNITKGQATVTLSGGQIFETTSCSEWKRQ